MSTDKNQGTGLIAFFLFLIWMSMPTAPPEQTHTIYKLQCPWNHDKGRDQGYKCEKPRYPKSVSYRVYPMNSKVITNGLDEYKSCVIYDAKNWKCETAYSEISMSKGQLNEFSKNLEDHEYYLNKNIRNPQVPYIFWWLFFIYTFFRDFAA